MFAESDTTKQSDQPYKYNGKELDDMHGLNWYDYSARFYDPALPQFTSVDPHAENYYSWSPYAYVANNPMRFTDPTGMDWDESPEAEMAKRQAAENRSNDSFWSSLSQAINQVAGVLLEAMGVHPNQLQSEDPEVNRVAKERRDFTEKTLNTANETMLSVVPGDVTAYKIATDKEVTKSDIAWDVAALLPVGKVAKGAKVVKVGETRRLWQLTSEGASTMKNHKTFGTFYKSTSNGLWWARDNTGHGGGAFKVFKEGKMGLEWYKDANQYGDFIINKHKGSVGIFIPWGILKTIK